MGGGTGVDLFTLESTNILYLTVSSTDSGWGDSYTPSQAEIQAYFWGWRMWGTGWVAYTTGTKNWTYLTDNPYDNTHLVTTVPTTQVPTFTPYTLSYQLASPTTRLIQTEGYLSLNPGLNQVELSEGVVIREVVKPNYTSDPTHAVISWAGDTTCLTRYRVSKFIAIYKNGALDPNWLLTDIYQPYGNYRANIPVALYDPTASYSATYKVLDTNLYTVNSLSQTATYNINDHTVLQNLLPEFADAEARLSVVEETKANSQQPPYIVPTLLNAWVSNSLGNSTIGYFKDTLGVVHLKGCLLNGTRTAGTSIFTVITGCRPLTNMVFNIITTNDGITVSPCFLVVYPSGLVTISGNILTYIYLDGISFRAEQ